MWNAVSVWPRREVSVAEYLRGKNHEVVCPMVCELKRVKQKRGGGHDVVRSLVPAYPGYLFARPEGLFRLFASAPSRLGSLNVIRMGEDVVVVRDAVVAGIVAIAEYAVKVYSVGQRVRVSSLDGLVTTIAAVNKLASHGEVSVWLDMLGSRKKVPVDVESLVEFPTS